MRYVIPTSGGWQEVFQHIFDLKINLDHVKAKWLAPMSLFPEMAAWIGNSGRYVLEVTSGEDSKMLGWPIQWTEDSQLFLEVEE